MSTLSVAFRIWSIAIFINAVISAIAFTLLDGTNFLAAFFILFIATSFFTWPLLILIAPIVRVSTRIPYDTDARIIWLNFMLILLTMAFYALLILLIGDPVVNEKEVAFLSGCTLISVVSAVWLSRKALTYYILHQVGNENINPPV